jgi:hypothetical protein
VTNWAVHGLDYLLAKYVVVTVALRDIGPQRSLFALLQSVAARISNQLLRRLRSQRWRQYHDGSKRENGKAGNVGRTEFSFLMIS